MKKASESAPPIRHNYTVFCNYALTSQAGNVSCTDCFQSIGVPALPALARFFVVVCFFVTGKTTYRVGIEPPEGETVWASPTEQETLLRETVQSFEFQTNTNVLDFAPLRIEAEGIYHVLLVSQGQEINRTPFSVFVSQSPQTE